MNLLIFAEHKKTDCRPLRYFNVYFNPLLLHFYLLIHYSPFVSKTRVFHIFLGFLVLYWTKIHKNAIIQGFIKWWGWICEYFLVKQHPSWIHKCKINHKLGKTFIVLANIYQENPSEIKHHVSILATSTRKNFLVPNVQQQLFKGNELIKNRVYDCISSCKNQ